MPTDESLYGDTDTGGPAFNVTQITLPLPVDQPQPLNPVITISLSDLPDPDSVQFPALQLGPRGQAVQFLVDVSLVNRQLLLRPKAELLPENDYFVNVGQDLRALSGQPLAQAASLQFHTGSFLQPPPMTSGPVTLSALLTAPTGLRARCALVGCHTSADQSGGMTAVPAQGLDFSLPSDKLRSVLVTTRAAGSIEGLLFVAPGLPERSYLIRKLVATLGFSRISGEPMPPGGLPALDPAVLQPLEEWIRQGAQP